MKSAAGALLTGISSYQINSDRKNTGEKKPAIKSVAG
jgi:hypothetical protein